MLPSYTMKTRNLVITASIIILGIYDFMVTIWGGNTGMSISSLMVAVGFKAPFVSFVFGFLAGHFFGYMYQPKQP